MQPWFNAFATAIAEDEPYYRECTRCDAPALPPREVCPSCGTRTLEDRSLSRHATVASYTTISATIPIFADDTPYTIVLADFENGVRLTGQLRGGVEEAIEVGDPVVLDVEEREDGYWIVTFEPR